MKFQLLALSSLRFYRRHPWQLILAVVGIALGVAVFLGIELANDSARRAFEASGAAAGEQTTHRLLPVAGHLPETVYRDLKRDRRFVRSAPVVEAPVLVELAGGQTVELTLVGTDLIEEAAVRGVSGVTAGDADPFRLLTEPDSVLVSDGIAARYGIARDDSLALRSGAGVTDVRVIGTLGTTADGTARLLTDIAAAQELAGLSGYLSRIDLRLDEAAAAALGAGAPTGTVLVPAGAEDRILGELTRAFNTNLTALGLLALVVGMFLIYSTISFTIVQRWRSIAVLRAVGLDRRELLASLLGEALAIGTVGTLLGVLLGHELSAGLLELVLRTLDDLYFRRALESATPSNLIYLLSAVLGVGATLVSALIPAVLAARRDIAGSTRGRLERSARKLAIRFAWAAVPTAALAVAILLAADRALWPAFVSLFLVLLAGAMLIPLLAQGLMRLLERPVAAAAGIPGRLAVRGVTDSLSRTGVATAALTVAVATVMSIGLMISSFRASLIDWIDTTVTADLYLDIDPDWAGGIEPALATIESMPEVSGLSRQRSVRLTTATGRFNLRAQQPGPAGYGIDLTAPAGAIADDLLAGGSALLVGEPLAYRLDMNAGDRFELPTPAGIESFEIAGVYRDYNTAGADLVIGLESYRRRFADDTLSIVGIHLAAGADESSVIAAVRETLGPARPARVRSTRFIRDISLLIFDQTFRITEVLRLLAGIVAFLGILSALMALGLEREREFAVLRSLGMSIRQLFGQNLAQTSLLGLAAGLAAMPLGCVLAWLLVHVINRRSFGWSMDFIVSADTLAGAVVLAVAAAVLAGIYPALVGARADMGLAWRDD